MGVLVLETHETYFKPGIIRSDRDTAGHRRLPRKKTSCRAGLPRTMPPPAKRSGALLSLATSRKMRGAARRCPKPTPLSDASLHCRRGITNPCKGLSRSTMKRRWLSAIMAAASVRRFHSRIPVVMRMKAAIDDHDPDFGLCDEGPRNDFGRICWASSPRLRHRLSGRRLYLCRCRIRRKKNCAALLAVLSSFRSDIDEQGKSR